MKTVGKTIAPRLPKAMREKLKSGGTHKNKKAYARKSKHERSHAAEIYRPPFLR